MNRNEILEAWAPAGDAWSLWARPVLFAQMDDRLLAAQIETLVSDLQAIKTPELASDAAVVVDLPGADSVSTGLALALKGYQPVPLYNGCTGKNEVVDQTAIMERLAGGAKMLAGQSLKNAPPAFLLDSLRMSATPVRPGDFDNRWTVYPQDVPGAETLMGKGIRRVILIRKHNLIPAADLISVLMKWQAAGISIGACDITRSVTLQAIVVKLPWWSRSPFQYVLHLFGLNRGPRQGFGHIVPEPTHG